MTIQKALFLPTLLSAFLSVSCMAAPAPVAMPVESDKPNALQQEVINRGYGMFIHFGVNTFNQTEWSDGKLPINSYNPTKLDVDSWVKVAKEAGFRHIVLITKHHDGFCLWDTKHTNYSVMHSPVKVDIVAEAAKACKKYDVKLGLYYSLWDRYEPSYLDKDPQKYVQFMKAQLRELLTNYGSICEIWFDGGWDRPAANWDIPAVYKTIKELQPDCAVTVNHTVGSGQDPNNIGQPLGFSKGDVLRYWPSDFRTKDPNLARSDDPKIYMQEGKSYYLPFEHTLCLSDRWNWFQKKDIIPARPLDELEELFYWTTANNVLLLNVPPGQDGLLRENECQRIFELADRLGIRGGNKPLPARPASPLIGAITEPKEAAAAVDTSLETSWDFSAEQTTLEIKPAQSVSFDTVAIMEEAEMVDLGDGFSTERRFHITHFMLEVQKESAWSLLAEGDSLGACKKITVPLTTASALRLTLKTDGKPTGINNVAVYDSTKIHAR